MAKNNANIFVPSAYSVWTAPLGTVAPTSPSGAPSASWYEVGFLSDQGITEGRDINQTNIFDLLGTLVGIAKTQEARPFTFEALESNRVVSELRYPGSTLATGFGTAEVQQLTVAASGGTITGIYWPGYGSVTGLAYNASAGAQQTALRLIPAFATATVTGTGPYVYTFPTALGDIPLPNIDQSGLTGGGASMATTTPGVAPTNTRSVGAAIGQNLREWLIYAAKGSKHKLFVVGSGEAVQAGTVGVTGAGASVSQFSLQPYLDSNGNFFQILDDDPAQAASVAWA